MSNPEWKTAQEIERLRAENECMRQMLEEIARHAKKPDADDDPWTMVPSNSINRVRLLLLGMTL
jgi:hypothetical protein